MNMPASEWRPAAEKDDLWRAAPAWRRLVLGAAGLTAVAVALPLVFPVAAPPQTSAPAAVQAVAPRPASTPAPQPATAPPQIVYVPKYIEVPAAAPPPVQAPVPAPAQSASAACDIRVPVISAALGAGTVTQILTQDMIRANIEGAEVTAHAAIDPAYASTVTVGVRLDSGLQQAGRMPAGVVPHIGDRVTMQGWYRNAVLPCNYIPNLVTADLGPAAQGQGGPPPASGQP